jgi:hypothetical protein
MLDAMAQIESPANSNVQRSCISSPSRIPSKRAFGKGQERHCRKMKARAGTMRVLEHIIGCGSAAITLDFWLRHYSGDVPHIAWLLISSFACVPPATVRPAPAATSPHMQKKTATRRRLLRKLAFGRASAEPTVAVFDADPNHRSWVTSRDSMVCIILCSSVAVTECLKRGRPNPKNR